MKNNFIDNEEKKDMEIWDNVDISKVTRYMKHG